MAEKKNAGQVVHLKNLNNGGVEFSQTRKQSEERMVGYPTSYTDWLTNTNTRKFGGKHATGDG